MQYLLDSNVLITANATYYESGRIPQFWDWLAEKAESNTIKIPVEIMKEITPSSRDSGFHQWIKTYFSALSLTEENMEPRVIEVLDRGYEFEQSEISNRVPLENTKDALLIAYALARPRQRCVVTLEGVQKTGDALPQPRNRKIPLVCSRLNIHCINTFDLIRELDFRIPRRT